MIDSANHLVCMFTVCCVLHEVINIIIIWLYLWFVALLVGVMRTMMHDDGRAQCILHCQQWLKVDSRLKWWLVPNGKWSGASIRRRKTRNARSIVYCHNRIIIFESIRLRFCESWSSMFEIEYCKILLNDGQLEIRAVWKRSTLPIFSRSTTSW